MNIVKEIGSPLYQWEIGRQVKIFPYGGLKVKHVHFSHLGDAEALVVIPKMDDGVIVADIPNILLQSNQNIVVYVVDVAENCVETLRECVLAVRARPKPADYVYTETEVLNYSLLDQRLKDLEGEGLANAVADYLEKNPVQAGATAEEAAQIAKNKADIETLTAEKLSADALPGAVNDALAEAKASGQFDGADGKDGKDGKDGVDGQDGYTPVKGVDYFDGKDGQDGKNGIDGKDGADGYTPVRGTDYWTEADKAEIVGDVLEQVPTGGGSGGATNLTLLQSADIAGIASVVATPPSPVSTVVVVVKGAKNKTGASTLGVKIDNVVTPCSFTLGKDGTGEKWGYAIMKFNGALWEIYKAPESSNGISVGLLNAQMPYYHPRLFASAPASKIEVYIGSTADDYLPTGGTIEIYGG